MFEIENLSTLLPVRYYDRTDSTFDVKSITYFQTGLLWFRFDKNHRNKGIGLSHGDRYVIHHDIEQLLYRIFTNDLDLGNAKRQDYLFLNQPAQPQDIVQVEAFFNLMRGENLLYYAELSDDGNGPRFARRVHSDIGNFWTLCSVAETKEILRMLAEENQ